jgi:hypothetical protein
VLVNVVNDQASRTGPGRALPRGRLSPMASTPAASVSRTRAGMYLEVVRPSARTSSELEPLGRQDDCRHLVTMALRSGVAEAGSRTWALRLPRSGFCMRLGYHCWTARPTQFHLTLSRSPSVTG